MRLMADGRGPGWAKPGAAGRFLPAGHLSDNITNQDRAAALQPSERLTSRGISVWVLIVTCAPRRPSVNCPIKSSRQRGTVLAGTRTGHVPRTRD
jgi:hypothetical protein